MLNVFKKIKEKGKEGGGREENKKKGVGKGIRFSDVVKAVESKYDLFPDLRNSVGSVGRNNFV